jgi:hypothetical protein
MGNINNNVLKYIMTIKQSTFKIIYIYIHIQLYEKKIHKLMA